MTGGSGRPPRLPRRPFGPFGEGQAEASGTPRNDGAGRRRGDSRLKIQDLRSPSFSCRSGSKDATHSRSTQRAQPPSISVRRP